MTENLQSLIEELRSGKDILWVENIRVGRTSQVNIFDDRQYLLWNRVTYKQYYVKQQALCSNENRYQLIELWTQ